MPSVIKNTLNINFHHINHYFNKVLPLFTYTNLVYVSINIGIFIFKCGTLSKFGLSTRCVNLNKNGIFQMSSGLYGPIFS